MRKALLLGLPDYDDIDLVIPAASNDVVEVAAALRAVGYADAAVATQKKQLTTPRLRKALRDFFTQAGPGDNLFVYLSCHGIEHEGFRYVVPTDFDQGAAGAPLMSDLDIFALARTSPAQTVLVVIDACRNNVALSYVEPDGAKSPPRARDAAADSPTIVIVHSSSGGQPSFFEGGDEGKSHFTSAFCKVLVAEDGPALIDALVEAVGTELRNRGNAQVPRIGQTTRGRGGEPDALLVKDDVTEQLRQQIADSEWCRMARDTAVFRALEPEAGLRRQVEYLILRAEEVVERSARTLRGDRWTAADAFPRVLQRFDIILGEEPESPITAPEAALLTLAPVMYEAILALAKIGLAKDGGVRTPDQGGTDTYMTLAWKASYAEDHRWARRRDLVSQADPHYLEDIQLWQLHRFLHTSGELWQFDPDSSERRSWLGDTLKRLVAFAPFQDVMSDPRIAQLLTGQRLVRLSRSMFSTHDELHAAYEANVSGAMADVLTGQGPRQWSVSERRIAQLLSLASRMALDPRRLPDAAAEHVGIDRNVDAEKIAEASARAEWHRVGDGSLSLSLECDHQAIDHSLQQEVSMVDTHLRWLHDQEQTSCPWAAGLPLRADARGLRPRVRDGRPAYQRPHIRFQLDPERIRQLLMGPKLYGDARYALREVYQNALDACRYRRARHEYMVRTKRAERDSWQPQIFIRTGTDINGRPYVECEDNGIGMDRRHLESLFAFAGRRFADSHEFHLEKAKWDEAKIPFWSNSRFGIGVLSYFMLADEVAVWSRRLSDRFYGPSDVGVFARILAGSDLFRTGEDQSACPTGGTKVRLYLDGRPPEQRGKRLLEHVQSWLMVAENSVDLVDDDKIVRSLRPGELTEQSLAARATGRVGAPSLICGVGPVDWLGQYRIHCALPAASPSLARGAELTVEPLADGIGIGEPQERSDESFQPRIFVNLKAEHAPVLSVDRNTILEWDKGEAWAREALSSSLFESAAATPGATAAHLGQLAGSFPYEAFVFHRALASSQAGGGPKPRAGSLDAIGAHPVDACVGWITGADIVLSGIGRRGPRPITTMVRARLSLLSTTQPIPSRPFEALARFDHGRGLSDSAIRTGHVAALLWDLYGYDGFGTMSFFNSLPWTRFKRLPPTEGATARDALSVAHLVLAAARWRVSVREAHDVANGLGAFGVSVAPVPEHLADTTPDPRVTHLLPDLHDQTSYGGDGERVGLSAAARVLSASLETGLSLREIADLGRIFDGTRLAVSVVDSDVANSPAHPLSLTLLSNRLNGEIPFRDRISIRHMADGAVHWNLTLQEVAEIAESLKAVGVAVDPIPPQLKGAPLSSGALRLIAWTLDEATGEAEVVPNDLGEWISTNRVQRSYVEDVLTEARDTGIRGVDDALQNLSGIISALDMLDLERRPGPGEIASYATLPAMLKLSHELGLTLGHVLDRLGPLKALGVSIPTIDDDMRAYRPTEFIVELAGVRRFHGVESLSVTPARLAIASAKYKQSLGQIADQLEPLRRLGIEVPTVPEAVRDTRCSHTVARVASMTLDAAEPLMSSIPARHLAYASSELREKLGDLIDSLEPLGMLGMGLPKVPAEARNLSVDERLNYLLVPGRMFQRRNQHEDNRSITAKAIVEASATHRLTIGEVLGLCAPLALLQFELPAIPSECLGARSNGWLSELGDDDEEDPATLDPFFVAARAEYNRCEPLALEGDILALKAVGVNVDEALAFIHSTHTTEVSNR